MEFRKLEPKYRAEMLEQRVLNLEAEYYNHWLNREAQNTLPDDEAGEKDKAIAASDQAMATIDAAHAVVLAELDGLASVEEPETKNED